MHALAVDNHGIQCGDNLLVQAGGSPLILTGVLVILVAAAWSEVVAGRVAQKHVVLVLVVD